jgi:prepilin-type N-terminal cleavage/methylation domain-containing protein
MKDKTFTQKLAFTLAEVLITLGIIGVVSALTLPSVITNYQKQQTVVQLRKVYNELNNVVRLSEVDNGPIINWDYPQKYNTPESVDFLEKYYLPYFKGAKIFQYRDISYDRPDGVVGQYGILLNNGTLFLFFINTATGYSWIFADINGLKGPNRVGRDIFVFDSYKWQNTWGDTSAQYRVTFWNYNGSQNMPVHNELLTNGSDYSCNKENTARYKNFYCGKLIEVNGWKIPDNYPW